MSRSAVSTVSRENPELLRQSQAAPALASDYHFPSGNSPQRPYELAKGGLSAATRF